MIGVAAGLDALGDGDFAFAAEQFHRAHFAQVHAHRIVGALDGFLALDDVGPVLDRIDVFHVFLLVVFRIDRVLVAFDDVDAHFEIAAMMSSICSEHLVLRQRLVQLVVSDDARGAWRARSAS
jgi:hypothetical protein